MEKFHKLFEELDLSGWKYGSSHRTAHMLRAISAPPESLLGDAELR